MNNIESNKIIEKDKNNKEIIHDINSIEKEENLKKNEKIEESNKNNENIKERDKKLKKNN